MKAKARAKAKKKPTTKISSVQQKIIELNAEVNKLKQAENKKETDKILSKLDDRAKAVWEFIKELGYLDDDLKYLMKGPPKKHELNLGVNTDRPYFVCEYYDSPTGMFLSKDGAISWAELAISSGSTRYLVIDVDNKKQVEVKIRVEFG